jgi:hypothetical protein
MVKNHESRHVFSGVIYGDYSVYTGLELSRSIQIACGKPKEERIFGAVTKTFKALSEPNEVCIGSI